MQIQRVLDSDVVMQFDECTAYEVEGRITGEAEARRSMEMSLRWAVRSKAEFDRLENPNALFGIVQGGMFESLREESVAALAELDLPGYAIGGVSVGEPKAEMQRIVAHTPHRLPHGKPRYLMGVGTPEDLVDGVGAGVDMFDCVMPTRNAQERPPLHPLRRPAHPQRPLQDRRAADRSDLRLPDLRALLARLPAPSRPLRRDARADARERAQPALLRRADARHPRRARGGPLRRLRGRRFAPIARAASDAAHDGERARRTCLTGAGESRRQRAGRSPPVDAGAACLPLAQPAAAAIRARRRQPGGDT